MLFVLNVVNFVVQKCVWYFFREMIGKYVNLVLNFQDMIIVWGN